ncbi:hypothetical protein [Desulfovibrio litoralis]|uniref:Uncharacterized protein n=1 Tax=Desulfovibrio litoralis DSM 11393 TaxID=1121455 RepID=A0A1M7S912_9BACT|nr:hypothetical protein [Desulfovibrio litoralis]SHN54864.1 hypothetical protein SAMN02745728_00596 [Desulfovibrio litoralis DSM 11393]
MKATNKLIFAVLTLAILFTSLSSALAQTNIKQTPAPQETSPSPIPDNPNKIKEDRASISVEHEGNDNIGAKLAFMLKESFNTSSLFELGNKTPQIIILVSTAPEFEERPNIGSVYSVTWVFSQGGNTLRFYIGREVGTTDLEGLSGLVSKILERTYGLSQKYNYLLKK